MRLFTGFRWVLLVSVGASLVSGCGGRARDGKGPIPNAGGSSPASGGAASGGAASGGTGSSGGDSTGGGESGGSGGAEMGFGGAPPDALDSTWVASVGAHGINAVSIAFEEDGVVAVHIWEGGGFGDSLYRYDATGERLSVDQLVSQNTEVVDPSGRFHAVSSEGGCHLYVDGESSTALGGSCREGFGFSEDGAPISKVLCGSEQTARVEVYDTQGNGLIASAETDLPCGELRSIVVTDTARERTLFSVQGRGEIFVFDWGDEAVDVFPAHDAPSAGDSTPGVINLALSHDGAQLLSVGIEDGLAWWDAETLEVQYRASRVRSSLLFDECSCRERVAAAVAWSEDDTLVATSNEEGGIDLRDPETKNLTARLAPPVLEEKVNDWSSEFGPVLARFSPDGARLVAVFPGGRVVSYDLTNR